MDPISNINPSAGSLDKGIDEQQINLVTINDYVVEILKFLQETPSLKSLLADECFDHIKSKLQTTYWQAYDKKQLVYYLEEYIQFSTQLLVQQSLNDSTQSNVQLFISQFATKIKNLCHHVQQRNKLAIQSLKYVSKFKKSKFQYSFQKQQFLIITKFLNGKQYFSDFWIPLYYTKYSELHKFKEEKQIKNLKGELLYQTILKQENSKLRVIKNKGQKLIKFLEDSKQFKYEPKIVKLDGNKMQALDKYILSLFQYAQKNYYYLQNIVYKSCISSKGFGFNSEYKIKNRQDKKSLLKIKMKIFSQQIKKTPLNLQNNDKMQQIVKIEEKQIQERVNTACNSTQNQLKLNVSDILTFKCLFMCVKDAYEAMQKIAENISEQKKKGANIKIVELCNQLQQKQQKACLKIQIDDLTFQIWLMIHHQQIVHKVQKQINQLFNSIATFWCLDEWIHRSLNQLNTIMAQVLKHTEKKTKAQLQQIISISKVNFQNCSKKSQIELTKNKMSQFKQSLSKFKQNSQIHKFIQSKKIQNTMAFMRINLNYDFIIQCYDKFCQNKLQKIISIKQIEEIGSSLLQIGNFSQSKKNYEKMRQILEFQNRKQSNQYVRALLRISEIQIKQGNHEKAQKICQQNLKIIKKIKGEKNPDYSSCLVQLGDIGMAGPEAKKVMENYITARIYYDNRQIDQIQFSDQYSQIQQKCAIINWRKNKNQPYFWHHVNSLQILQRKYGILSTQSLQKLSNLSHYLYNYKYKIQLKSREHINIIKYLISLIRLDDNKNIKQNQIQAYKNLVYLFNLKDSHQQLKIFKNQYQKYVCQKYIQLLCQNKSVNNLDVADLLYELKQEPGTLYIISKLDGKNSERYLNILLNKKSDNFQQIIHNYEQCLQIYENKNNSKNNQQYLSVLNKLSGYYETSLKKHCQSIILLLKQLKAIQKQIGMHSEEWLKLARTILAKCQASKNYRQYIYVYKNITKVIWDKYLKEKDAKLLKQYIIGQYNIGNKYEEEFKNARKAEEHFDRVIKNSEQYAQIITSQKTKIEQKGQLKKREKAKLYLDLINNSNK